LYNRPVRFQLVIKRIFLLSGVTIGSISADYHCVRHSQHHHRNSVAVDATMDYYRVLNISRWTNVSVHGPYTIDRILTLQRETAGIQKRVGCRDQAGLPETWYSCSSAPVRVLLACPAHTRVCGSSALWSNSQDTASRRHGQRHGTALQRFALGPTVAPADGDAIE